VLSEKTVLETSEALQANGLAAQGFRTLILDDCWQNESRDAAGFLHADVHTFPHGMGWLAQQLRSKGLALGLYTTPGDFSCMGRPASQGHEKQDVQLWLQDWGASYLKYCVCNTTHERRMVAYAQMQDLLATLKTPVTYEIDPAMEMPMTRMDSIGNVVGAHDDVADNYESWVNAIRDFQKWGVYDSDHTRIGHWPLVDIVQIGRGGQSFDEYRSQVTMYTLLCSPLVLGVDFRNDTWSAAALPHLSNPEVLKIHQDPLGKHAVRIDSSSAGTEVWARPLQGGNFAVALWNANGDSPRDIGCDVEAITGTSSNFRMRDVWARSDNGTAGPGRFVQAHGLAPHALRLFLLSPELIVI
jgi:alpha-galactosidase